MKTALKSLAFGTLLLPFTAFAAPVDLAIDTQHSSVGWVGKKVAGQHNGTVKLSAGTVSVDEANIIGGTFTIDMTSISNIDLEPGEWRDKLENHLKSPDFFNVASNPTATFVLDKAVPKSKADGNSDYTVTGKLTIKGITHEVTFPATIVHTDGVYRAKATVAIDRTLWDIKYNSGKLFDIQALGDKMIYDEIQITLDVVAGTTGQ